MTARPDSAYSIPLEAIDVSDPQLYQDDTWYPYFERLRREAPVHWCQESRYGPYWSVCKYKDIMQVEVNHQVYSSDGAISVLDAPKGLERQSFIAMDPPKHDEQRKVVSPAVAPGNLANMEELIRERTIRVLEGLPRNETFDWVDRVSIELTTMMLATLFDYPWDDRRQLTYWSDVVIANVDAPESPVHSEEEKFGELTKMTEALGKLFNERAQLAPKRAIHHKARLAQRKRRPELVRWRVRRCWYPTPFTASVERRMVISPAVAPCILATVQLLPL